MKPDGWYFSRGDTVRVVSDLWGEDTPRPGDVGKVEVVRESVFGDYGVKFEEYGETVYYDSTELEIVKSADDTDWLGPVVRTPLDEILDEVVADKELSAPQVTLTTDGPGVATVTLVEGELVVQVKGSMTIEWRK